jgi:hypothetical protein
MKDNIGTKRWPLTVVGRHRGRTSVTGKKKNRRPLTHIGQSSAAVCKQSQLWTGIVSLFRRSDAPSKEYHRLPSDKVTELQL